jgi:hypothetical protein
MLECRQIAPLRLGGVEEEALMPVSFPLSVPVAWSVPEVVEMVGFVLALGLIHVIMVATVIQLLRKRRFRYILIALAVYGWALASWSGEAVGLASLHDVLGGPRTFAALNLFAQLIFVGLTLLVLGAAMRRVRAARPAMPSLPPMLAPTPPVPQLTTPGVPVAPMDADAWLL